MTHVNLITGFLGSGKTTTLLHLLAHKPAGENWAVLVNEFGDIGIDGALLANSGALLKEIPGGCMCCVNGLPMQVGLNTLLKQHKPDRLLIEPTGLGHPKQMLAMLTDPMYQPWLQLQATFCLLDPRQLGDARVVASENFRDQLQAADIIIANKQDRWQPQDAAALETWQQTMGDGRRVIVTTQGQVDPQLLQEERRNLRPLPDALHHHAGKQPLSLLSALNLTAGGRWRRAVNAGQGYYGCGWIFDAETVFDTIPLLEWARHSPVSRVKGVLRIAEGAVYINRQGDDLRIETQPAPPPDSRIELIHDAETDWNPLQHELLKIRLS